MASPLSVSALLSAMELEHVRFTEYRDWRTHNRNHVNPWGPVNGVVIHHTAGHNALNLVYDGYSGLPGPLSHAYLDKGGTVWLTGHGRANHAGTFAQNAHDAVVREDSTHPRPDTAEPVDGNRYYYGIEIENLGNGSDPYPAVQYEQAVRWAAALCRAHGWSEHSVIGHKEGTRRKVDPSFDMDAFRSDVAARLAGPGAPEEEDVPHHRIYRSADHTQTVPAAEWERVRVNEEFDGTSWAEVPLRTSFVFGPCFFTASAGVTVSGLTGGEDVKFRFSKWRETEPGVYERSSALPTDTPVQALGNGDFTVCWTGHLTGSSRERLCLEVLHYEETGPVTVSAARLEALYWPM
jgi:hypothetical protein